MWPFKTRTWLKWTSHSKLTMFRSGCCETGST
jgi:hypothetical protein